MRADRTRRALAPVLAGVLVLSGLACGQTGGTLAPAREAGGLLSWLSRPVAIDQAQLAFERGEHERAVTRARQAMQRPLRPRDLLAASSIVCASRLALGRPEAALPYCSDAVVLSGGADWRELRNRAEAWLGCGEIRPAVRDYEQALARLEAAEREPSEQELRGLRGRLQLAREQGARKMDDDSIERPASPAARD